MRAALAALMLVALPSRAFGYDLGYHEDVTQAVMRRLGYAEDARRMVTNYNFAVDIKVNTIGLVINYLHDEHFDDRFSFSMHKAMREKLLSDLGRLRNLDCDDDDDDLWTFGAAMGLFHHAIQDYYAHSNHAELVGLYHGALETYDDVVAPVASMQTLNSVWKADVPNSFDESLLSGAYFTKPPRTTDALGGEVALTHDILNKDQPVVSEAYFYSGRVDRRSAHSRSMVMATRDLVKLDDRFRAINPRCYRRLRDYDFSVGDALAQWLKYRASQLAGLVVGHWRSGNDTVSATGLSVTIGAPGIYPAKVLGGDWTFAVSNTGVEPVASITLAAPDGLLAPDPLPAPTGWTVQRGGGQLVYTAPAGRPLAPGEAVKLVLPADPKAVPGLMQVTTDTGWGVEALGPVPQDYVDASFIRAVALLADVDPDAALDQAGVPAAARRYRDAPTAPAPVPSPPGPRATTRTCGCGTSPDGTLALLIPSLALGLGRRPRRRCAAS